MIDSDLADELPPLPRPEAVVDVRMLPWRPRARVVDAGLDLLPDAPSGDDIISGIIALVVTVVWVLVLLLLLLGVVVVLLELWLVGALALLLLLARFAGVVPWTVFTGDGFETYRWLPHATARVREINGSRRARFSFSWA